MSGIIPYRSKKEVLSDDEIVWRKWVDFEFRGASDLCNLLESDVADGYKKRALCYLLAFDKRRCGIYFGNYISHRFFPRRDTLKALSPDLLQFAANLVCAHIDEYRLLPKRKAFRPDFYEWRCDLNQCVANCMSIAKEQNILEALFDRFSPVLFYRDRYTCPVYYFYKTRAEIKLHQLIALEGVDDSWKIQADSMVVTLLIAKLLSNDHRKHSLFRLYSEYVFVCAVQKRKQEKKERRQTFLLRVQIFDILFLQDFCNTCSKDVITLEKLFYFLACLNERHCPIRGLIKKDIRAKIYGHTPLTLFAGGGDLLSKMAHDFAVIDKDAAELCETILTRIEKERETVLTKNPNLLIYRDVRKQELYDLMKKSPDSVALVKSNCAMSNN